MRRSQSVVILALDARTQGLPTWGHVVTIGELTGMAGYLYILASRRNGTLYIGVTNDLVRRVYEHREGLAPGFTKKYGVKQLVHFEEHATVPLAIQREKTLKHWIRRWKLELIESRNSEWRDLWSDIERL